MIALGFEIDSPAIAKRLQQPSGGVGAKFPSISAVILQISLDNEAIT